jgi:Zn-dependent protease
MQLALQNWREALELLPRESRQHQVISAKITELGTQLTAGPIPPKNPAGNQTLRSRLTAGISAIALAAWKLKALLLGLTKATTLLTMFVSFSVYWTIWGWRFALGIVLSIYVHEMGHVIALRRLGFKASAPMFIPGLGAVIRLQQQVVNPNEDAEIGLAGPIYGLGAAAHLRRHRRCWRVDQSVQPDPRLDIGRRARLSRHVPPAKSPRRRQCRRSLVFHPRRHGHAAGDRRLVPRLQR